MSRARRLGLYQRDYESRPLPTVFQVGSDVARTGPRMVSGRQPTPAGERDMCPYGHSGYVPMRKSDQTWICCGVCYRILFAGRKYHYI